MVQIELDEAVNRMRFSPGRSMSRRLEDSNGKDEDKNSPSRK
jgi:hypothetical protein